MDQDSWFGNVILVIIVVSVIGAIVWGLQTSDSQDKNVNIEVTSEDSFKGIEDAKVTIVNYSDLQCPACKSYEPIISEVIDEYKDKITFVYRHFPLKSIHPNAESAAIATESAKIQDKFWEMKEILFDKQSEWSEESDPKELFIKYAEEIGLDKEKFEQDLENESVISKVDSDYNSGIAIGINSTPTFIVNGRIIDNPQSVDAFKSLIDDELAKE